MSMYTDILQKIATSQNEMMEWEKTLEPAVKRERDLIRAVQERDDRFAMKELIRSYRGVINQQVRNTQLANIMDPNVAQQYGVSTFKEIIKTNFDLSHQVKPVTYITNTMDRLLKKRRYQMTDFVARKSEDLTMKSGYVAVADDFLKRELNRAPTDNETFDFIKNDMGKKILLKNVQRIRQLTRRELSGDVQLGQGDTGEYLTLMDVKNVGNVSAEDIFQNGLMGQKIENELAAFTRPERRLIRNYFGLGQFSNKRAKSLNEAATSNNMTYYEARRIVERLKTKLGLDMTE